MAAPVSNKCEKCFTTVPPGAVACPECGAPIGNTRTADADAEVYPDLAKANLARMRGDYKQAEAQLLSVLKRFPNNPSANEMLGDLAAEREDYVHAAEWYEMSLEIVPGSTSIARKLKDARAHNERKDTKDTTAQLGLPDPSSRMPILVGGLILVVVAITALAYYLGARGNSPRSTPQLRLEAQQHSNPTEGSSPPINSGPSSPAPEATVTEDQQLLQQIKSKSADAAAILGVFTDPRSSSLVVTFSLNKDDKALAARIARDTFDATPTAALVTLRGVAEGKVVYMADSTRSKVAETETPDWKQRHEKEPDAWVTYVLQNEWPATTSNGSTPQNPPGSEGPTSSGAAPTEATTTSTGGG